MRIILTMFLFIVLFAATASAQQVIFVSPPPSHQIQWQPVAVPGRYYVVQRPWPVMNSIFGPLVVFIPDPPQIIRQPGT